MALRGLPALVAAAAAGAGAAGAVAAGAGVSAPGAGFAPPLPPAYCAIVMNSTAVEYFYSRVDASSGAVTQVIPLPSLDGYGGGISAGVTARGLYMTVSGNVSEEEDFFRLDVGTRTAAFVPLVMPPPFASLTVYGVAGLADARGSPPGADAVAFVVGFDGTGRRYGFIGGLNATTGAVTLVSNISDAYRGWAYVYPGVVAWDPATGVFYLSAVTGSHDYTTLVGVNTTAPPGPYNQAVIAVDVPYVGLGDFMALAVSPALAAAHGGGLGLLALVDDDDNTGAALWLLTPNRTAWTKLFQYPPSTLEASGANEFETVGGGLIGVSVFYDQHRPVANQIVSAADLSAAPPGKEARRTAVLGSQMGTAIADLLTCPAA